MAMEDPSADKIEEAAPAGQASSGVESGGQTVSGGVGGDANGGAGGVAQGPQFWQVGDQKYPRSVEGGEQMAKAYQKWQGDYTRKMQEYSKVREEHAAYNHLFQNVIRKDPELLRQVEARMRAGQSKEQAVEQTAAQSLPPEVMERLQTLEADRMERVQSQALDEFEKKHTDLTNEDWDSMEKWMVENKEWLARNQDLRDNPSRMLTLAYAEVIVPKRTTQAYEQGQRAKEEEVKKGKSSSFLGSQAPTAGAKASQNKWKRGMTPAEEKAYAEQVWSSSKQRK